MPQSLRQRISRDEFDYQTLLDALQEYRRPRDRITRLLRQGTIIRVKKGLYIFGDDLRRGVIHRELLANLVHGPSYVSLEYALGYRGLIPERVEAVTSVTVNRSRQFDTPLGRFIYRRIPLSAFRTGVERVEVSEGHAFLMALPEKALADKLYTSRVSLRTQRQVRAYLSEDLRIESESLRTLDPDLLADYAKRFGSAKIKLLCAVVRRLRHAAVEDRSA